MLNTRWTGFAFTLAGLVASLGIASAQTLQLLVTESGGPTIPVIDNGALDVDPTLGVINANTSALNLLLVNYNFSGLGSSRLTSGLSQTGSVSFVSTAVGSINVTATDIGYTSPTGNPKTMTTSASDSFRNTSAGNVRTFQSFFDPTNTLGGTTIPSPLLAFVPPVGAGPFNTSNPGVNTPLGTQPIPYSLTNTTIITLSGRGSDQFTGITTITAPATAVPEPGSLAMLLGLGVTGTGLLIRRRK